MTEKEREGEEKWKVKMYVAKQIKANIRKLVKFSRWPDTYA